MKSEPRINPIQTKVFAAFFDSGRRNVGTPFEIASTPVSATAPEENPFSRMNNVNVPPTSCPWKPAGLMRLMSCAINVRYSPYTTSATNAKM